MTKSSFSNRAVAIAITAVLHLLLLLMLISGSTLRGAGRYVAKSSGELVVEATIAPLSPHPETLASADAKNATPHVRTAPIIPAGTTHVDLPVSGSASNQPANTVHSDESFQIGASAGSQNDFEQILLAHIERFRHYPDRAKQEKLIGQARVTFTMDRPGNVLAISVTGSSGSPILDTEAVNTVLRAQPLPAIPFDLPDKLEVELPVSFDSSQSGTLVVAQ